MVNLIQAGLFVVFVFSILSSGVGIYSFLNRDKSNQLNKIIFLGESLLLGSIFLVGVFVFLSLIGLYKAQYLWGAVGLNFFFLVDRNVRVNLIEILPKGSAFNLPAITFIALLSFFILRNCYFLIDVDSMSTYLFIQKLWLQNGNSIFGSVFHQVRIFFPEFDFVPASLGISIFAQETFFPELINIFWRLIVLLLVFGYTSYRFNKYYGLAAAMLVIFNDHFFYSGVNHPVLINGAVIALLFACVYNFWESRIQSSTFRFFLALIFLSQLPANKYQVIYVSVFLLFLGILIQEDYVRKIKDLFKDKKLIFALLLALLLTSFWYLKNFIVTKDPFFPLFAGKFHSFGWIEAQDRVFRKVFGGLGPLKFFKYFSYLFIWPGVNAAKFVIIAIFFFPAIILVSIMKNKSEKIKIIEFSFWLVVSLLSVMGICFASHQDPRYYRYPIGIFSFTTVLTLNYVLSNCFGIRNKAIMGYVILIFALPGYSIIYQTGSSYMRPTFKENLDVLLDKIHTADAVEKFYPQVKNINKGINKNKEKFSSAGWDEESFNYNMPQFLLPTKPVISRWFSTVIRWDSYSNEELIKEDLRKYGIKWIMQLRGDALVFLSAEEYAHEVSKYRYNLGPKKTFFDYNWPPELSQINY